MNHGLWLSETGELGVEGLVDLGVAAEAAGWDGVFVSDSLPFAAYPDPWVLLSGMAARTDGITLGTWVVPVPRYHPWELAQQVATLDRLSDGRVLFGVGLGNDPDYEAYGTPYDPPALAARLDESLEIIADLWAGGPVDFDGEHFTLEAATVEPRPVQTPRVPILTGAWWPNRKPFHRGARWDGIVPWFAALVDAEEGPHGEDTSGDPMTAVREAVEYYQEVADEPGEIVLPVPPAVNPDAFVATCEDLGATWTLTTDLEDGPDAVWDRVEAGPPG